MEYAVEDNTVANALMVDPARLLWGDAGWGPLELAGKSGQWHHFRDCYKIIQYTQHSVSSLCTLFRLEEFSPDQTSQQLIIMTD